MTLLKEPRAIASDRSCGVAAGRCASAGVASGVARVMRSVEDAESVRPGDVAIVPYASLAWTVVFGRAAAVIAERGGELSALATAARERRAPMAVGVKDAMRLIADGANVTVNATAGKVRWHASGHRTPYLCAAERA